MRRGHDIVFCLVIAASLSGCAHRTGQQKAAVSPRSFQEIAADLHGEEVGLKKFSDHGPFSYALKRDIAIALPDEPRILADFVLTRSASPAPIVVFSHGNQSHKEAHRYQAERIASWGMHALVLQLPNEGRWLRNGETIYKVVKYLSEDDNINPRIDSSRIILAGHSFGGSAITVAAGMGAPVLGLILLDPAVVHDRVKTYLRKLRVPVMLLGADRSVFRSRKRGFFYQYPRGDVREVSVRGATHDDAQFPSMFALNAYGEDPYTSEERQNLFASAITATAFSLASAKNLDFAWQAFNDAVSAGLLKNPKRRHASKGQAAH